MTREIGEKHFLETDFKEITAKLGMLACGIFLCTVVTIVSPDDASAQNCYKTIIAKPTPFNGNGGEIIVLGDGTIWKEVSYQYLYLYEDMPSVVVCPNIGKMILGNNNFDIVSLAGPCYEATIMEPSPFNGNGGEIIILNDQTIWKDVSYQYLYLYEYSPSVLVCPSQ